MSKTVRERILKYASEHEGATVTELAAMFCTTEDAIVKVLGTTGKKTEDAKKSREAPFLWDDDKVFRLKAYLVQGMQNTEIARNLGCKPQAVADYKRRHREELRRYLGNGAHEVFDEDIDGGQKEKPSAGGTTEGDTQKEDHEGTLLFDNNTKTNKSQDKVYSETEQSEDETQRFERILDSVDDGVPTPPVEDNADKWCRRYLDAVRLCDEARKLTEDAVLLLSGLQVILDEEVICIGTGGKERLSFLMVNEAIRLLRSCSDKLFET